MVKLTNTHAQFLADMLEAFLEDEDARRPQLGIDPRNRLETERDVLKTIKHQLRTDDDDQDHTGDLLDYIADIIMQPMAAARLNHDTVTNLREVILTPREQVAADALRRSNSSIGCTRCGNVIVNQELATVLDRQLYCIDCVTPSVVSCNGVCQHGKLKFNKGTISGLVAKLRSDCPNCKSIKETAAEIASNPTPNPGGQPTTMNWEDTQRHILQNLDHMRQAAQTGIRPTREREVRFATRRGDVDGGTTNRVAPAVYWENIDARIDAPHVITVPEPVFYETDEEDTDRLEDDE